MIIVQQKRRQQVIQGKTLPVRFLSQVVKAIREF